MDTAESQARSDYWADMTLEEAFQDGVIDRLNLDAGGNFFGEAPPEGTALFDEYMLGFNHKDSIKTKLTASGVLDVVLSNE